jgi:hypothetical protein
VANVTIRLQVDPTTRKKTVIISYESDSSALPIEHEDEHRRIVDKLIEGGAIKAGEVGKIIVERETEKAPAETPAQQEAERQRNKRKG